MKRLIRQLLSAAVLLHALCNDLHARDFDFYDGIDLIREKHPERYQRIREFLQKRPDRINGWVGKQVMKWGNNQRTYEYLELSLVTIAMHMRDYEMIDLLVEFGVAPCSENYGWCPVFAAEKYELHDMLDYLNQKMNGTTAAGTLRLESEDGEH